MKIGDRKKKKGLSEMVGYILLISMTIILSLMVYGWLKTYVPTSSVECADGASLFMQDFNYSCPKNTLNLTLKNNGRFDLAGYFIHATTNPTQELAVTDISVYTPKGNGGAVTYWSGGTQDYNPISAGSTMKDGFDLSAIGQIYSIEIVPMRYELIKNRNRPVSCSNAKITEKLSCTVAASCNGRWAPPEDAGVQCDGTPNCQSNCLCSSGYEPDNLGGCTLLCGNGRLDGTEQCDDGNKNNLDGCSSTCQIETNWYCVNNPMPSVCTTVLFQYLASAAKPLDDGWTGYVCGSGSCNNYNDYIKSSTSNSCSVDSSCGSYYMTTQRNFAAYKLISTSGYKNIKLTYYSGKSDSGTLTVEYNLNDGSWSSVGTISNNNAWTKNSLTLPSNAGDVINVKVRFWLSTNNNNYLGLFDSVNITAQKK